MPVAARQDLIEWGPDRSAIATAQDILSRRVDAHLLLRPGRTAEITDDRPFNEYFFLRRKLLPWWRRLAR